MADMIDWSTEYDIFHPDYIGDPFTIWDELRGTCPVARTDKYGGSWLPTTYEDVTSSTSHRVPSRWCRPCTMESERDSRRFLSPSHPSVSIRPCTPSPAAGSSRRSLPGPWTNSRSSPAHGVGS